MPTIEQLHLATVRLPDWHPRADEGVAEVFGFVVRHDDGVVVVDTGVGAGNELIDELYGPTITPLRDALHRAGVDERDVGAIVNTHLHFDHCGQNHGVLTAPIWVTDAELRAAEEAFYTVPEWATIDPDRRRIARDGEAIAPGVRLLETPGHTPGHQSVVVDTDAGVEVIVGQCAYSRAEFDAGVADCGEVTADAAVDPDVLAAARHSLERIRTLAPRRLHFSHEPSGSKGGS